MVRNCYVPARASRQYYGTIAPAKEELGTFAFYAGCSLAKLYHFFVASFIFLSPMTQDQIKDLKGRAEALRRYL